MRIIIYTHEFKRVSGIQTFERNFIKRLSKYHDITYVYRLFDGASFVSDISEYAEIVQDTKNSNYECDICIYSSIRHGVPEPEIKAKKYFQMVHADLKASGISHRALEGVQYISVGKSVQVALKRDFGIDSVVIPNILDQPTNQRALRFVTASRIAKDKGFDRIVTMAKKMRRAGVKFTWEIYGESEPKFMNDLKYALTGVREVVFMGSRDDVRPYIQNCDYLVQLSDHEGFCYSIYEALQCGVPCIVTNWRGQEVIEDGKNGYVLDMDLSNFDIDKIYTIFERPVSYNYIDPEKTWLEILI